MSAPLLRPLPLLFLAISAATAVVFDLPSGRVKCVTEELRPGAMSVAYYHVANAGAGDEASHCKISMRVSDPKGESLHLAEAVESGRFAFVAAEEGSHMACFWLPRFELSESVAVDFEWRIGIAAKEWPAIAKKDKIQVMEMELKKLEDSINSIHEEMIFLREKEEEAQRLTEGTNSKMGFLSFLSLIICLGVAGLQLWHLKAFFERQKIL